MISYRFHLNFWWFTAVATVMVTATTLIRDQDPKDILNWCLDARHHKSRPGPTDGLHEQCKPWERRSCCTKQTTVEAHTGKMYNFDYEHCRHIKPMSPGCRRHFVQDLCFYQCSPNTGPWVVKVNNSKIRNERFFGIPLCASECTQWFLDCQYDLTCATNWNRGFNWTTGTNQCHYGTSCQTFRTVYGTAANFCQTVWDGSWTVVPDTEPCMHLWFEGGPRGNPNDAVAQRHLEWLMAKGQLSTYQSGLQPASTAGMNVYSQTKAVVQVLIFTGLMIVN